PQVSKVSGFTAPPVHVIVLSVRLTDQPAGERVVSPKATPAGALRTIFTRSAFSSLAAVSVKNVGWPVGNVFGLISSWAKAGAASPLTAAATTVAATPTADRMRMGFLLRVSRRPPIRRGA